MANLRLIKKSVSVDNFLGNVDKYFMVLLAYGAFMGFIIGFPIGAMIIFLKLRGYF